MKFNVESHEHNNATFNRTNQDAAQRQTEALRQKVYEKYERMIGKGKGVKNMLSARRLAAKELKLLPQYWDEDKVPRREITPSSSAVASIRPWAGAVYVAFKSNPSKEYYYPVGMGTAETAAKAAEKLVTDESIGKAMHNWFSPQHALKKKWSKSGKSYSYTGKIFPYKGKDK